VLGNPLISLDHNTGTGGNGAKAEQRSANSKAAKASSQFAADTMMAVAMTPAYQAAYNNPISLNIGGKDVEMSQGDLHKHFTSRVKDVQKQIKQAKAAGVPMEDIVAMQQHLDNLQKAAEITDPNNGLTPDDQKEWLGKVYEDEEQRLAARVHANDVQSVLGDEYDTATSSVDLQTNEIFKGDESEITAKPHTSATPMAAAIDDGGKLVNFLSPSFATASTLGQDVPKGASFDNATSSSSVNDKDNIQKITEVASAQIGGFGAGMITQLNIMDVE